MDEEDISEILNVFRVALISDKKLSKADSITLRTFFSEFVNNTYLTNFIIQEYVQQDLYEEEDTIESFNKMLQKIGSNFPDSGF